MNLSLYSWNVNGIRSVIKKGALQTFIATDEPDILCLQETKAKPEQVELDFPGYNTYWNSAVRAGYSGVAILSKLKPLQVVKDFSPEITQKYKLGQDKYGNVAQEGRVLSLEFDNFWLVTVYTPNSKGDLSRLGLRYNAWDPAFLDHLKTLAAQKPVVACGDFNVAHHDMDLSHPESNVGQHGFTEQEKERFGDFLSAGFIDTYRTLHPNTENAFSWWSPWSHAREHNVGWRIDYWLASRSAESHVADAEIHQDVTGSDHCPVSLTLTF